MTKTLYLLLCMVFAIGCPGGLHAQIIITVAGSGAAGYTGDGSAATAATLDSPSCIAVDGAGNVYINDQLNNCVRRVAPSGIITTVAGSGSVGYTGDGGPATAATLSSNWGMTVDAAGNIYIADQHNNCVRKVNTAGIITTIAGNGTPGYSGDGLAATLAQLHTPLGIAVDGAGNIYIGDVDNRCIRMVNTSGIISTIAGDGSIGFSGDGGLAILAQLGYFFGLAVDGFGNLFICDGTNNRVRKVNSSGIISTVAGDGTPGSGGDGSPAVSAELNEPTGIFVSNAGDMYIADYLNNRIRKISSAGTISTIAGTGTMGFYGDGGLAVDAKLAHPLGVAMDASNTLIYVSDLDNVRIRLISNMNVVSFTGGKTQDLTVCENATNAPINSLLTVLDHDIGLTDTWGLVSGPYHGAVTAAYTAVATGSAVTPTGLSYTPAGGYTGNDTFTVNVTDGIASDVTSIYVTVEPVLPSAGAISGASNVCVGASITLAETITGGAWSSSSDSATVTNGIVTGIYAGSDMIIYTVTNTCGTASISKTISVNPLPNPGIITGQDLMCIGSSVTLTDTIPGGIWSAANTVATVTQTATGSIVTGLSKGADTIIYTATNTLCEATATFAVTIDTFPGAGVITGPAGVCTGATISLADTAAGGTWGSSNGNATFNGNMLAGVSIGIDTVSYSITNICGTATATQAVIIEPVPAEPVLTQDESILSVPPGYTSYEWTLNGVPIPGAVTDSYTVTVTGIYEVIVTNSFGCTNNSPSLMSYGCSPADMKVYPNPTDGIVYIDWCKKVTVRIICADGKQVQTVENTNKVDLGELPDGVYFLSVYDMGGIRIKTRRITKLGQ